MNRTFFLLFLCCCSAAWSQQAGLLSVDDAVNEAVAHNLELVAARANISIAEARQITAKLRPNPVLTTSADHLDLLGTGYNNINNGGPNEYSVRTDFVFERGGKRAARMELASAGKAVAELNFRDSLRRLVFDVQSAVLDVQIAKEVLALAKDNLRNLTSIVDVNTARVRAGDLAGVELSRSQIALMQYQTAIRQAEMQLRQAKTRLVLLLGRQNPSEDIDIQGPIRRDPDMLQLEEIRSRAQLKRPDLLQLQQVQARNQADLKLQIAQGRVDYTAGVEYRRQQAPSGMGNSLGFFLSMPLPVFNRNQGEIVRAERETEQAKTSIRALQMRVENEVTLAWQQYVTSRESLSDIEARMLSSARQVRDTTDYSYRRGEATLVEFLDAQRAFNDVMQSFNEARANYARSLFLIDSVTGSSVSDK